MDGLRGDAIEMLGAAKLPNYFRLRAEGAYTDNARTDADHTVTLPNHASQLTGRWVRGPRGHNYVLNMIPGSATTLHSIKGAYVSSVFDVVHDAGLTTALFVSKAKFILYDQSYDETNGAEDHIDEDNGRDKIDHYVIDRDTDSLIEGYLATLKHAPHHYTFIHIRDPDTAGHEFNWDLTPGSEYLAAVTKTDSHLGKILDAIDRLPKLTGKTAIIVTSDHGGRLGTMRHEPATSAENYTIPFYVWGDPVASGAGLYAFNSTARANPGRARPSNLATKQPIRNGDSANLALDLLGLKSIPGSTINIRQNLKTGH